MEKEDGDPTGCGPRADRFHGLVNRQPAGKESHPLAGVRVAEHDLQVVVLLADSSGEVSAGKRAVQDIGRLRQDVWHLEERHHRDRRVPEHFVDQRVSLPQILSPSGHADHAATHIPVDASPSGHVTNESQHVGDHAAAVEPATFLT